MGSNNADLIFTSIASNLNVAETKHFQCTARLSCWQWKRTNHCTILDGDTFSTFCKCSSIISNNFWNRAQLFYDLNKQLEGFGKIQIAGSKW